MMPPIDPQRWDEIQATFEALVDLGPAERSTRLAALGVTDPALHAALESLLAADVGGLPRLARLDAAFFAPTTPAHDPLSLVGRTVSHFHVLEPLGSGGMGVVYRAEDTRLGRAVAMKFLLPHYGLDPSAKERFLREAHSAAALDHPNLCTIHEVGESEDGHLFLAMALYPGETLKVRLAREGPLPIEQALEIARQLAQGLACAHAAGIVHRDLKPANVMLLPDSALKILDFGLAKARDESLSASSARLGTAAYMAPEQVRGEAVDARTDLWALGVVLYEMLTGRKPFAGDHEVAIAHAILHDEPIAPSALRGEARVVRVAMRCLQKNPADRWQSAEELSDALRGTHAVQLPGWPPRRRLALGATGVALALVASALLWQQASRSRQARAVNGAGLRSRVPSLAVLPLNNHSGDPAQEYFADAMTDELTTTLAKIEGLRVIAHRSVLRFKHSDRSVPEIAGLLEVQHVLDGSVLQNGDRIRITANLIDAATNTTVWGERFERERRDVLALQREVALAIARAIEIKLSPQDRERLADAPEVDPEAFDLYIKGTQARYRFTTEGWIEAEDYFGRAIAKDSSYAPAYAGLAFVHMFSGLLQHAFTGKEVPARRFAEKALALDPHLADPLVVLGLIREFYDWDWAGAEKALRQAIRLNPGHAEARHELSLLLVRQKRFDEALREALYTLYLAPISARFQAGMGHVYLFSGRYDEAVRAAEKALALDSSAAEPYWLLGMAYGQQGRYGESIEALQKCLQLDATGPGGCRGLLGYAYAVLGEREKALEAVEGLKARRRNGEVGMQSYEIAEIYAGLGQREQALQWLERTVEPGAGGPVIRLGIDPTLRSLHAEPRFQALLKKMGLKK